MMSNAELGLPNKLRRNPSVIQYTLKEILENDTLFCSSRICFLIYLMVNVADLIGYNYNQFLLISFLNELMQTLNGNDFTWSGLNAIHSIWWLWSILFNLLRATVCA